MLYILTNIITEMMMLLSMETNVSSIQRIVIRKLEIHIHTVDR